MQSTFTAHYNGNRQPFGLYSHPSASTADERTDAAVHLAANCALTVLSISLTSTDPGVKPLTAQIDSA